MFTVSSYGLVHFAEAISNRAASADEKAAIAAEIASDPTGRGYAGMASHFDVAVAMSTPYTAENPSPRGSVARDTKISAADLYNMMVFVPALDGHAMAYALERLRLDTESPLNEPATLILSAMARMTTFDFGEPTVYALVSQMAEALVTGGVISQETAETFTRMPDPNWQSTIEMSSPIVQAGLSFGTIITARDVDEALI